MNIEHKEFIISYIDCNSVHSLDGTFHFFYLHKRTILLLIWHDSWSWCFFSLFSKWTTYNIEYIHCMQPMLNENHHQNRPLLSQMPNFCTFWCQPLIRSFFTFLWDEWWAMSCSAAEEFSLNPRLYFLCVCVYDKYAWHSHLMISVLIELININNAIIYCPWPIITNLVEVN